MKGSVRSTPVFSGHGTFFYSTSAKYEGEYKGGNKHGAGKYTYPDGAVYEGQFADGQNRGWGKHTKSNGDFYIGEWSQGDQHGAGVQFHSASGGTILCSRFEKLPVGNGIKCCRDGTQVQRVTDGKVVEEAGGQEAKLNLEDLFTVAVKELGIDRSVLDDVLLAGSKPEGCGTVYTALVV